MGVMAITHQFGIIQNSHKNTFVTNDDDDELEDIDLSPWLSERELASTADYELTRLKNMKLNYEMLLKLGE